MTLAIFFYSFSSVEFVKPPKVYSAFRHNKEKGRKKSVLFISQGNNNRVSEYIEREK